MYRGALDSHDPDLPETSGGPGTISLGIYYGIISFRKSNGQVRGGHPTLLVSLFPATQAALCNSTPSLGRTIPAVRRSISSPRSTDLEAGTTQCGLRNSAADTGLGLKP